MVCEIDVKQLKARLDSGLPTWLLDVRQPWEHEVAALAESTLIPLAELHERHDEIEPPEGALVVVYCHHGIRSRSGAAILEALGHPQVASLAGGIDAWSRLVDPDVPRY
jgi:adenylyltransferase/sulfurtransferase